MAMCTNMGANENWRETVVQFICIASHKITLDVKGCVAMYTSDFGQMKTEWELQWTIYAGLKQSS